MAMIFYHYNNFEDFYSFPTEDHFVLVSNSTSNYRNNSDLGFDKRVLKKSISSSNNSGVLRASNSTLCKCNSKAGEPHATSNCVSPITPPIKWCIWKKPESGCIKLNTDGSIVRGYSGFGGLLRDHQGKPLCGFVTRSFQDNIFLVELLAVWRGIMLALDLGVSVIWIESDSLSVVKTLNREQSYDPKIDRYLGEIWNLLTMFEDYRVTHTWREANKAADYLSRKRIDEDEVVLWPIDFPNVLHNIIKDDAQRKIYFRP
ncbi:E3 ubiquitin-protein ligase UPL1-like isoform X1 [Hibiscus syriacus]|uniref:E3 ubiquitin-protein ligase UPL1-like isoform X1 n=1 Tax=Hibiscus syriacus TaxID=106335 RepID=A0A6A2ZEA2_HIBSY|nr:uncharacterized protein LOC120146866 [Hibiscus syriacus]KAE8689860.1 E3 ubiquitin-protein ligase UPL1-like isoform X1 [Hibiscus syriacus]